MEEFVKWIDCIEDVRQQSKIWYTVQEVILIVFSATLSGIYEWEVMEIWARHNIAMLRDYLDYPNGIPSHDTLQRVIGMISTDHLQKAYNKWIENVEKGENINLRKLICIDGKTMRGNRKNDSKPNHIVTAWSRDGGFSLGQKTVKEKTNEIKAIPDLLEVINIKGSIITIDAMGTQTAIVKKIREKHAHYVLAVKENQPNLFNDIKLYFEEESHLEKCKKKDNYLKTVDKNHGQADVRQYYQTSAIGWLADKERWAGIKTIGMVERSYNGVTERRYYISSLPCNINDYAYAVRGHWSVESMHWHLDVLFKEDSNHNLDKTAAANQNIIRKWCLSILKHITLYKPNLSLRQKQAVISFAPAKYLDYVFSV